MPAQDEQQQQLPREAAATTEPSCRVYVGNLSWKVRWQHLKDHMKQAGEVLRADVFEDFQGRSKGCGIVEYTNVEDAQKAIKELTDTELFDRLIFVREDREDGQKFSGGRGGGYGSRGGYGGRGGGPMWASGYYGGGMYRGRGGGGYYGGYGGRFNGPPPYNMYGDMGYYGGPRAFRGRGGMRGGMRGGFGAYGGGFRGGRGGYAGGAGGHGDGSGRQVFVSNLPWRTSWQDLKDLFRECGDVVRADVMTMPDGRSKGVGTVLFSTPEGAQRAVELFNEYMLDGRPISVRIDRVA
ncbi:putative Gbp1p protein [Neospora caninum Liverpool]|uniref:Gbp1p protein, putative n=1 Tax=Neospora caninum (strain Liverpool) TaxID=572307 RepID=F0VG92_NEOCL|nr:putative Gbp1p protein [Neospora caninum Liverpool]CBZ52736.1 putative Gbp1p protein [Neospora caninum Liverpool]CEL66717.1 TPA: Gbp1p protein, putative [Neospora caninum Liverpool]|eukprot:XP_003882768.1 putative Gbp1p protein [Neospora caninum Liverpool]